MGLSKIVFMIPLKLLEPHIIYPEQAPWRFWPAEIFGEDAETP